MPQSQADYINIRISITYSKIFRLLIDLFDKVYCRTHTNQNCIRKLGMDSDHVGKGGSYAVFQSSARNTEIGLPYVEERNRNCVGALRTTGLAGAVSATNWSRRRATEREGSTATAGVPGCVAGCVRDSKSSSCVVEHEEATISNDLLRSAWLVQERDLGA
jgi:hypothetical protein